METEISEQRYRELCMLNILKEIDATSFYLKELMQAQRRISEEALNSRGAEKGSFHDHKEDQK
jgi:hypothetical protein